MRIGYVVHTYPALTHAFMQREVDGLRRAGQDVYTFSIHRADAANVLSVADHKEAESTASILPVSPIRLAAAHVKALCHPGAYFRALAFAIRNAPPGLRARVWQFLYFGEAICVWAWARKRSIDHLHAHFANVATDLVWLASVFDRFARPRAAWRWSFTIQGPTEFFAVERFNLSRKVLAADGVICISDFCRSQLMLLCPPPEWSKLEVIHSGADLDRYRFRPPRQHDAGTGFRILCVGRLVHRKGQHILLQALHQLIASGIDASVTLVGSGPTESDLAAQTRQLGLLEHVCFAGPRSQDELAAFFAEHDAFCLPSFAEGIPVVLMEAMATGLPVVTTPIAGTPELVRNDYSGLLVPPGRPDALALALARLAGDADLRARLAGTARQVVESGFDSAACAAQLALRLEGMQHKPPVMISVSRRAEQNLLHDV